MKRDKGLKVIASILITGIFLFLAFGSNNSKNESNYNSNSSTLNDTKGKKWVPSHYATSTEVCHNCPGKSCTRCFGRGWYTSAKEIEGHYEEDNSSFQVTEKPIRHSETISNTEKTTNNSYSNPDANPERDNQIVDNSWETFLVKFKAALVNKDKEKIMSMADKDNFFDGGGGATVLEFLNDADISKETGWDNLINSINNGTKGEDEKQTIGSYPNLCFLKKNNQWYWKGIVGD
jgi:hypothetical protein